MFLFAWNLRAHERNSRINANERLREAGREKRASLRDRTNRQVQVGGSGLLDQISGRSGAQRLEKYSSLSCVVRINTFVLGA